jgi:hypothetical protein
MATYGSQALLNMYDGSPDSLDDLKTLDSLLGADR